MGEAVGINTIASIDPEAYSYSRCTDRARRSSFVGITHCRYEAVVVVSVNALAMSFAASRAIIIYDDVGFYSVPNR